MGKKLLGAFLTAIVAEVGSFVGAKVIGLFRKDRKDRKKAAMEKYLTPTEQLEYSKLVKEQELIEKQAQIRAAIKIRLG